MKSRKIKFLRAAIALWTLGCAPLPAQSKPSLTPQEQAILKFVLDWWREGVVARHTEMVKKYFADNFIQHNPNLAGGTAAIEKMISRRLPMEIQPTLPRSETPVFTISQGDLLTLVFEREARRPTRRIRRRTTSTTRSTFSVSATAKSSSIGTGPKRTRPLRKRKSRARLQPAAAF